MDIDPVMEAALWMAVRRSRSRAARANPPMAHSLPDDYAIKLYHEQQGRCDITGQPFSLFRIPHALVKCLSRRAWTVSTPMVATHQITFGWFLPQ
jgi:hypothetical protein